MFTKVLYSEVQAHCSAGDLSKGSRKGQVDEGNSSQGAVARAAGTMTETTQVLFVCELCCSVSLSGGLAHLLSRVQVALCTAQPLLSWRTVQSAQDPSEGTARRVCWMCECYSSTQACSKSGKGPGTVCPHQELSTPVPCPAALCRPCTQQLLSVPITEGPFSSVGTRAHCSPLPFSSNNSDFCDLSVCPPAWILEHLPQKQN